MLLSQCSNIWFSSLVVLFVYSRFLYSVFRVYVIVYFSFIVPCHSLLSIAFSVVSLVYCVC